MLRTRRTTRLRRKQDTTCRLSDPHNVAKLPPLSTRYRGVARAERNLLATFVKRS
jgi:hypothetical protein